MLQDLANNDCYALKRAAEAAEDSKGWKQRKRISGVQQKTTDDY